MKVWIIAVLIVATIVAIVPFGIGHHQPVVASHPVTLVSVSGSSGTEPGMPFQASANGTNTSGGDNYSYISIHLLSYISLYGENYVVQANASTSTVIVRYNSAEVYSEGVNVLTVEYAGVNVFPPVVFTNHVNHPFTLQNLTGSRILINDYSYRLNRSFTVVYTVQVMTLSNYRTYTSNHLIPPQEQFTYTTMVIFAEYNGVWILSMLIVLTLLLFTFISEKRERDSDTSLLE